MVPVVDPRRLEGDEDENSQSQSEPTMGSPRFDRFDQAKHAEWQDGHEKASRSGLGCGEIVGGVLIILGFAFGLTNYLIDAEIPALLREWVQATIHSRFLFLIILNLLLIVVACMMDIFSAIVVVVRIMLPIATAYGIDPIHLGVMFLVNLELGYLMPPMGLNLFFSAYRFERPLTGIYRAVVPFLILGAIIVALVTYVPWLSLCLIGK